MADTNWVHIIAEPGDGTYVRAAPRAPTITSILKTPDGITLTWTNSAKLQQATFVTGPWTTVTNAPNPFAITADGQTRFFRAVLP